MAEACIPVDLFNPGQVFACLGFLEAADLFLGDAEASFDWSETSARFCLKAKGETDPFLAVLSFLASASVRPQVPRTSSAVLDQADITHTFPSKEIEEKELPFRLIEPSDGQKTPRSIDFTHWADSSRDSFKNFAGHQTSFGVMQKMLGEAPPPNKGKAHAPTTTTGTGLKGLWHRGKEALVRSPFDREQLLPLKGTYGFDPSGSPGSLDIGYSPNKQKHEIRSSPLVEILAALGLEHTRPKKEGDGLRYSAWNGYLPPILARPVLAGAALGLPTRNFVFRSQSVSQGNKVFSFAKEEP